MAECSESSWHGANVTECSSPVITEAMIRCHNCNRLVPPYNMELHLLRSCTAARMDQQQQKPPARPPSQLEPQNCSRTENTNHDQPCCNDGSNVVEELSTEFGGPAHIDLTIQPDAAAMQASSTVSPILTDSSTNRMDDEAVGIVESYSESELNAFNSNQNEVIDIMDDDEEGIVGPGGEGLEQWTCSRCTLVNPMTSLNCEACQSHNPDQTRQADPVRRERLVHDPVDTFANDPFFDGATTSVSDYAFTPTTSSASYLASGAIVGGVLGAATSFARGRPVASGVLSGAMGGAIGGAVLNEILRDVPESPFPPSVTSGRRRRPRSQAPGTVSRANTEYQDQPQQRRRRPLQEDDFTEITWRPQRARGNNTRTTTTSVTTRQGTRVMVNDSGDGFDTGGPFGPFMQELLFPTLLPPPPQFRRGAVSSRDVDGMSYDQLLSRFGDGSENMGATEAQIASLPETTISNVNALPAEARQCSICLEDFRNRQTRKVLPCFHGFHRACVVQWLRRNGNCPICKFRLQNTNNTNDK